MAKKWHFIFPKVLYCCLVIKWLNVISRTFVERGPSPYQKCYRNQFFCLRWLSRMCMCQVEHVIILCICLNINILEWKFDFKFTSNIVTLQCTWICEMYMGLSLHIYIYHIEHRNLEIRKTRNDIFVQVRTFLLPLRVKVLRHKEIGIIFLFWLFHLPPPHNTCGTRNEGLREQAKANRLRPVSSLN